MVERLALDSGWSPARNRPLRKNVERGPAAGGTPFNVPRGRRVAVRAGFAGFPVRWVVCSRSADTVGSISTSVLGSLNRFDGGPLWR